MEDLQDLKYDKIEELLIKSKEEFRKYIEKYDNQLLNISKNTFNYTEVFQSMIKDYNGEINHNTKLLTDIFSKMNVLNEELPKLEELYEKIHEMKNLLEVVYKSIKI